jgi:hypothetical protein
LVPLLRELVTIEGGKPVSRTVPLSRFPEGTACRALVEAFLHPGARLLVSDQAQLRLAHEALLTHWPRARDQVAADARDLELRGRLEEAAARWRGASCRDKRGRVLPAGPRLDEGMALCARWGAGLPAEVTAFVAASRQAARHNRLRGAANFVALPVIVALFWAGLVAGGYGRSKRRCNSS